MSRPKVFGSLPLYAWAVIDQELVRIVGGDVRCAVFWTKAAARTFVKERRRCGYQIIPVVVRAVEGSQP